MSNKQILKKAIEKAEKNGWDNPWNDVPTEYLHEPQPCEIIFSHSFAKALFGEGYANIFSVCTEEDHEHITQSNPNKLHAWQHHLQQMVISDDPIKYLESYL